MSKIELSKSKLMAGLMTSVNFCDGCSQPVSIIITGEDKQTVVSSLSQLKAKAGLSIITDPNKVLAFSKRLGLIENRDETKTVEDNAKEEFELSTDFCNNNLTCERNTEMPKEHDDFRSNDDMVSNGVVDRPAEKTVLPFDWRTMEQSNLIKLLHEQNPNFSFAPEKCKTNGSNETEFNADQSESCFIPQEHNTSKAKIQDETGCSDEKFVTSSVCKVKLSKNNEHENGIPKPMEKKALMKKNISEDSHGIAKKRLQCKICPKSGFFFRAKLLRHYASCHFKKELLPFADVESLTCLICKKKLSSLAQLLLHLGSYHKKFAGLLPEDVSKTNIEKVVENNEIEEENDDFIASKSEAGTENVISEKYANYGNTVQEEVDSLTIVKVEEGAVMLEDKVFKDADIGSSPAGSNISNTSYQQIPSKRIPGKLALCKQCGTQSDDLVVCSRCKKKFPEDVKLLDYPAFRPEPDTRNSETINESSGNKSSSVADASIFDGSVPGSWCSLTCRSIRIGNYKVLPKEKITITEKGVQIKVPDILNPKVVVIINIAMKDILKVHAHFGKQMPLLFLYISPAACQKTRKLLKMTNSQSFYLEVTSADETQKRITILPDKLNEDSKVIIKQHFSGTIFQELENKAANEILVRSSPKDSTKMKEKMSLAMAMQSQEKKTARLELNSTDSLINDIRNVFESDSD